MEEWRSISEWYEVSNYGKVRSVDKIVPRKGSPYFMKGKELSIHKDRHGYCTVGLRIDGKHTPAKVHRLVASAFIENPCSKPFVNHIDNNPSNNHVSNLEWCTHQENMRWMHEQGRAIRTKEWLDRLHESQSKSYKKVIGRNLSTGEEIVFENLNSVKEAGFQPSCVCLCCNGTRNVKQHKGYSWRYA